MFNTLGQFTVVQYRKLRIIIVVMKIIFLYEWRSNNKHYQVASIQITTSHSATDLIREAVFYICHCVRHLFKMKKYLGLIIIIGCLLPFSHGEENLSGLCRSDADCTGGAECFGYFCYHWVEGENTPVNQKKKCRRNDECEAEGPDMKCMKTHKGKGLCKKSFRDCDDDDTHCNIEKGKVQFIYLYIFYCC